MEGDLTWGGEHTIQHADDISQNYTPETHIFFKKIKRKLCQTRVRLSKVFVSRNC